MDFKIIHIEETDSTNRWLRDYTSPLPAGACVVVADFQTAGKGCGTNSWESERGKNLTFSMLIHPKGLPANAQFHITEVVSVALCETLESYINNKVEIKWPNDNYVGERKICGILIENRLQGSVIKDSIIGIGLNVNQREFKSDAPNPVSLAQVLGHEEDRNQVLDNIMQRFIYYYGIMEEECYSELHQLYMQHLYRKDALHPYSDEGGIFRARIRDVEPTGHLVLEDGNGRLRRYDFKEVRFILNGNGKQ